MITKIHVRILAEADEKRFDGDRAEIEAALDRLNTLLEQGGLIMGQYSVVNMDGVPKEHVFIVHSTDKKSVGSAMVPFRRPSPPKKSHPHS